MPLNYDDLIKVCELLAGEEGLRVTAKESLKGAGCAFVCAFVGGVVGGPIGLGIGGAAGSLFAAYAGQGKYKSAVYIITNEMPASEKRKLAAAVEKVIKNIDATDVLTVITFLSTNGGMRSIILDLIKGTLVNNMGLKLA